MGNPTLDSFAAKEPKSDKGNEPNPAIKVLKKDSTDQTKSVEYKFCQTMHKVMCKGSHLNIRINGAFASDAEQMNDDQVKAIEQLEVLPGVKSNFPIKNDQTEVEVRLLNLMMHRMHLGQEVSLVDFFPPENLNILQKKAPKLNFLQLESLMVRRASYFLAPKSIYF